MSKNFEREKTLFKCVRPQKFDENLALVNSTDFSTKRDKDRVSKRYTSPDVSLVFRELVQAIINHWAEDITSKTPHRTRSTDILSSWNLTLNPASDGASLYSL